MTNERYVTEIPVEYQKIFFPIQVFNHVQSQVFDDVTKSDKHIVVSSPTGSGKTIIFELAIVELLTFLSKINCSKDDVKIVYVAPTKALCNEMFKAWQKKFKTPPCDLQSVLLTGDSDPDQLSDLQHLMPFQIIVTTPEKWDSLTRKWKDHREIAATIKLLLIDEVHLVGDENRGPTVEAIVSRMKTFQNDADATDVEHDQRFRNAFEKRRLRIIAASASLPNISDVAYWISAMENSSAVKTFRIPEDKRPVKLDRYVYGYSSTGNSFQFDAKLNSELIKVVNGVIRELSAEKPILVNGTFSVCHFNLIQSIKIFCQTRRSVETTLNHLVKNIHLRMDQTKKLILENIAKEFQDEKLQSSVPLGLAFHHAGLTREDRDRIESTYRNGLISILLSTSTLAMGVNLPAHTVIIKSTEVFVNGVTKEISESTILQMMGRAGRQQFDSSGRVIIMTQEDKVKKYENLVYDKVAVESHLHKKMVEHLNAEIVLNTITDLDVTAMQWMRTTFLYARTVSSEASNLGMNATKSRVIEMVDKKLKDLCTREVASLQKSGLVLTLDDDENRVLPTEFGQVMARYFLSIETMNMFRELRGNESIVDILNKITRCTDFNDFYLRMTDKKTMNKINSGVDGKIRFPIGGNIVTVAHKASCLLQAVLDQIPIEDVALNSEAIQMLRTAERLSNSLIEYLGASQFPHDNFNAILSSVQLAKCFKVQLWENSRYVCKQLSPDMSSAESVRLANAGFDTIESILNANPREIERILDKRPPFGQKIIDSAAKLPRYKIGIEIISNKMCRFWVVQTNEMYEFDKTIDKGVTLLVGDSTNKLLSYDNQVQYILSEHGIFEKESSIAYGADLITAHLIHHNFVGIDQTVSVKVKIGAKVKSTSSSRKINTDNNNNDNNSAAVCKNNDISTKKSYATTTKAQKTPSITQFFKKVSKIPPISDEKDKMDLSCGLDLRTESKKNPTPNFNAINLQSAFGDSNSHQPLYDFDYEDGTQSTFFGSAKQQTSFQYNNRQTPSNGNFNKNQNAASHLEYHTPISRKIKDEMVLREPSEGFVTAKAIFKNVIRSPSPNRVPCAETKRKQFFDDSFFEDDNDDFPVTPIYDDSSLPSSSFASDSTNSTFVDECVPANLATSPPLTRTKPNMRRSVSKVLNSEFDFPTAVQTVKDFDSDSDEQDSDNYPQLHAENIDLQKPYFTMLDWINKQNNGKKISNQTKFSPSTSKQFSISPNMNRTVSPLTPITPSMFSSSSYQTNQPTHVQQSVPRNENQYIEIDSPISPMPFSSPIHSKENEYARHYAAASTVNQIRGNIARDIRSSSVKPSMPNTLQFEDAKTSVSPAKFPSPHHSKQSESNQRSTTSASTTNHIQNGQSHMKERHNFMSPDSPLLTRKKPKLSVSDLVAIGVKQREQLQQQQQHNQPGPSRTSDIDLQSNTKISIQKPSMSTVLTRVKRTQKPKPNYTKMLEECKQRLNIDGNYTKSDYDKDFVRYQILKVPVETETSNEMLDDDIDSLLSNFGDDDDNEPQMTESFEDMFDFSGKTLFD